MPDLTLEAHPVCEQLLPYRRAWSVGGYAQVLNRQYELECSCKGFQFRHTCKHVKTLDAERCTWHGAYDEALPEGQKTCPRCGGELAYVQVAA